MTKEAEVAKLLSREAKQTAALRARDRVKAARWDIDVALFFFAVLIIIIILLNQEVAIEIVAPVAAVGLGLGWLMGWRKGRQLYKHFYDEELSKLKQGLKTQ